MNLKKIFQLAILLFLSTGSFIAQSAISSEGWFYKAKYFSEGSWHIVLKGAYESSEKCNKALTDSTVWDTPPYAIHGSCRFYYSDEYDALSEAIKGEVGVAPSPTLTLSGEAKLLFVEKFTQLNNRYGIESYRKKLDLMIRSAFGAGIVDPDDDDDMDEGDDSPWEKLTQAEEKVLIYQVIELSRDYNIVGYKRDLEVLVKSFM